MQGEPAQVVEPLPRQPEQEDVESAHDNESEAAEPEHDAEGIPIAPGAHAPEGDDDLPSDDSSESSSALPRRPQHHIRVGLRAWPGGRKIYNIWIATGETVRTLRYEFARVARRAAQSFTLVQNSFQLSDEEPITLVQHDKLVHVLARSTNRPDHLSDEEHTPLSTDIDTDTDDNNSPDEQDLDHDHLDLPQVHRRDPNRFQGVCGRVAEVLDVRLAHWPCHVEHADLALVDNQEAGDCLWAALAHFVDIGPHDIKGISLGAVPCRDRHVRQHLRALERPGCWGDTVALLCAAHALQREIHVLTSTARWSFVPRVHVSSCTLWLENNHFQAVDAWHVRQAWPLLAAGDGQLVRHDVPTHDEPEHVNDDLHDEVPTLHGGAWPFISAGMNGTQAAQGDIIRLVRSSCPKLVQPVHLRLLLAADTKLGSRLQTLTDSNAIAKVIAGAARRARLPVNESVLQELAPSKTGRSGSSHANTPSSTATSTKTASKKVQIHDTPVPDDTELPRTSASSSSRAPESSTSASSQGGNARFRSGSCPAMRSTTSTSGAAPRAGWVQMVKQPPPQRQLEIRSQDWSVPVVTRILPGREGIALCSDAKDFLDLTKGLSLPTACPQAVLARTPHSEYAHGEPQKVAFTGYLANPQGGESEQVLRVGWLHQLSEEKVVPTKTCTPVKLVGKPTTCVVKVVIHKQFAAADDWTQAERGDIAAMKKGVT